MLKRLRLKFVCINMVIITAMLVVIFSLVLHFTQATLEAESLGILQSASLPPARPGAPGMPGRFPSPCFSLGLTPQGGLIASGNGYYDLSDEATLRQLLEEALATGRETGVLRDQQLRFLRMDGPGPQTVAFTDISAELSTMRTLRHSCAAIGILSFLLFLGLSFLLARWAVRPVEQAWQQQKQFVADASHELKTPLTVIMTNAELLQDPSCAEIERTRFTGNILTVSRQMRVLTENLLELARADNGNLSASFAPLDLSGLISDALLPFEPVCYEADLTLLWEIAPGLTAKGSEQHLRQIADILLDNACKYSTPGGEVRVALRRQGRQALLSVASPGEPLSRADLKNIFKRFYRVDKARSRTGSYGLGLSIAQSIAEAHQGRIWAESHNGSNTFFIQLPLA